MNNYSDPGKPTPANPTFIDFDTLWPLIAQQFQTKSALHGPLHWKRVERNGLLLAEKTGADVNVVRLFALFHDSRRENDESDEGHGTRGAEYARNLCGKVFHLPQDLFELLRDACIGHADGKLSDDPTIATCWDADRLDNCRTGLTLDPAYLSTEFGREIAQHVSVEQFLSQRQTFPARRIIHVPASEDQKEMCEELNQNTSEILSQIPRLKPMAIEICQKMCEFEWRKPPPVDFNVLQEFYADFYAIYQGASGILTNNWGSDLVLATFKAIRPFWQSVVPVDCMVAYEELPERLDVYRGGPGPKNLLQKGFSWTCRQQIAEWFARNTCGSAKPTVISTTISKIDILGYMPEDGEVIIDPSSLDPSEITAFELP